MKRHSFATSKLKGDAGASVVCELLEEWGFAVSMTSEYEDRHGRVDCHIVKWGQRFSVQIKADWKYAEARLRNRSYTVAFAIETEDNQGEGWLQKGKADILIYLFVGSTAWVLDVRYIPVERPFDCQPFHTGTHKDGSQWDTKGYWLPLSYGVAQGAAQLLTRERIEKLCHRLMAYRNL